jgi:4-carboxymuconolactone decarboxylase
MSAMQKDHGARSKTGLPTRRSDMTSAEAAPRLANRPREELSGDDAAAYDHILRTRKLGFMPNLFAVMAHSPSALRAVAGVGEHVRFNSAIDPELGEAVICHVAQTVGNRYEWCHHIHKVPEALRGRVGTLAAEREPAPVGPALRYARQLAEGEEVGDALVAELRDSLGATGLVDLTVMVGYYRLVGIFCAALAVPLEEDVRIVPYNR